jgi:hypothetical protein
VEEKAANALAPRCVNHPTLTSWFLGRQKSDANS